jgi:MFS family permease
LFLNVLSWQSLLGTILVLHARAIGIDTAYVGLLNSFQYFSSVLGLATKPLAERIGSRRLLMGGWILRNILVAPVILTPWVFHRWGVSAALALLGSTTLLFCVTRSLAGIAWSSWQHEIVPPEHLARFYTLETMISRLLAVAFGVMAFLVLGHQPPLWRFSVIAAFGVAIGLLSIRFLARVPGGAPTRVAGSKLPWHHGFGDALRDQAFVGLLVYTALIGFGVAGLTLLFTLLLRDRMQLGPGPILLLSSLGSLVTLATSVRWRRVADTQGSPVTLAATSLLLAVCALCLLPASLGHMPVAYAVVPSILLPVAQTGNYMAATRAYMLRMDANHRHAYNAIWSAGQAVAGGVASLLTGWLVLGGKPAHYAGVSLALAGLLLIATLRVIRLKEPGIESGNWTGARQTLRGIARIWGYVLRPAASSDAQTNSHTL